MFNKTNIVMNPRPPKYIIKKEDTLQTITQLFAIEQDTWKQYHNSMCRLDHIIRDKIPEPVKEVFLLPELWDKELILNRPVPPVNTAELKPGFIALGYQNTLYLKNIIRTQNYGVKIAIQNNTKVQTIKYKIQVKWLGKTDDCYHVEVSRPQAIYINDIKPDLKVDQLAVDVYNKLYPIVFKTNRNGNITDIANFEEITKRGENALAEIKKYRFGESLDKYLRICSYSLRNERTLLQKLEQDYFICSYFLGIHQTYEEQYTIHHKISLPLSQSPEKVLIQASSKLDIRQDQHGMVKIIINGETSPESSGPDATYYAKYFIDPATHLIDAMITRINIQPQKEITIKITNIT